MKIISGRQPSGVNTPSAHWRHVGLGVAGNPRAQIYERNGVRAIVGHEGGRWHISISTEHPGYPTWDEIADARYHFISDAIDMALILPPVQDYINCAGPIIRHVFHLWEVRDTGLPVERGDAMPRTHEDGSIARELVRHEEK